MSSRGYFKLYEPISASNDQDFFLKYASNLAEFSNVKYNRHGCIIVHNGKIVSEGYNHYVKHFEHKYTMHAEIHALSKLKKKKINSDYILYVVRIGTDNMGAPLKYSKPCDSCTDAIIKAGIKKIYYSTNDEFEEKYKQIHGKESDSKYSKI